MQHLHIIGGGIAGLSAALSTPPGKFSLSIYEASGQCGGRARSYADATLGCEIDNGNHLLLHANCNSLELIKTIGAEAFWQPGDAYRLMDMRTGIKSRVKAPFWLPTLPLISYWPLLNLLLSRSDASLEQAIPTHSRLAQQWMHLIAISVTNTSPEHASAGLMRRTLQQIIRSGPKGAQPLMATAPLGRALISPMLQRLQASHKPTIYYRRRLRTISIENNLVSALHFSDATTIIVGPDDRVILAVAPHDAARLLPELTFPSAFESIANIHFRYESPLEMQFYGLLHGNVDWVFSKPGVISTTTSAANERIIPRPECIWRDICALLAINAPMPDYRIVTEKRATIKASPEQLRRRPKTQTPYRNLMLAGDYVQTGLPCTIESAILSGRWAAEHSSNAG